MSTRDDEFVTGLLERGAPAMRIDLDGVSAAGERRVRRRRAAYGLVGTTGVAAVAALALTFGPLRSAGPELSPATPAPPSTRSTSATTDPTASGDPRATSQPQVPAGKQIAEFAIVAPDGRTCGKLPDSLIGHLTQTKPDLADASWLSTNVRAVGPGRDGGTGRQASFFVDARLDPQGNAREVRRVALSGRTLGVALDERVQQGSSGVWDGRYAVLGRGVMGVQEVWLWDSITGERTLIGAKDAQGWGPDSSPVVGGGFAMWRERNSGNGRQRMVRFDLAGKRLTILSEGSGRPVAMDGTTVWVHEDSGQGAPGRFRWTSTSSDGNSTSGGSNSDYIALPHQFAADGQTAAWIRNGELFVTTPQATAARRLMTVPELRTTAVVEVSGEFITVWQSYAGVDSSVRLVIDVTSGNAARVPDFANWHGAVLTRAPSEKGKFTTAYNVTDASAWRDALRGACR